MPPFEPPRASTPSRIIHSDVLDTSTTSSSSLALQSLSPENVEILDSIIQRAKDENGFLYGFKAYNEVLQERGMNAADDVVYYRMLLKVATVKGDTWGERWTRAKAQQGIARRSTSREREEPVMHRPISQRPPFAHHLPLSSDALVSEDLEPLPSRVRMPSLHHAPLAPLHHARRGDEFDSSILETASAHSTSERTILNLDLPRDQLDNRHSRHYSPERELNPGLYADVPFIPRARHTLRSEKEDLRLRSVDPADHPPTRPPTHHAASEAEDAWERVRQQRQEKVADDFRTEMLLARCFDVWVQGTRWIIETNNQVDHARSRLQTSLWLRRWREAYSKQRDRNESLEAHALAFTVSRYFTVWRRRLRERQVKAWRDEIRRKMAILKSARDKTLCKEAWARWRRRYHLNQLEKGFRLRALSRAMETWHSRINQRNRMVSAAQNLADLFENRRMVQLFQRWCHMTQLSSIERRVHQVGQRRLKQNFLHLWNRYTRDSRAANAVYSKNLLRHGFENWRKVHKQKQILVSRAVKFNHGLDKSLLRAVLRIWVSRERGRLFQRVRAFRLQRNAWDAWVKRLNHVTQLNDRAEPFIKQSSVLSALEGWRKWRSTFHLRQQNAEFSVEYHGLRLAEKHLFHWRLKLRANLKQLKQARAARRFFVQRAAWDKWRMLLETRRREAKLKAFSEKLLNRVFTRWASASKRNAQLRNASQEMSRKVNLRLLRTAISAWTNRVVTIKLREIQATERWQTRILRTAYTRWKTICLRHVENLNLMDSFHFVRQEDVLRNAFAKWYNATRNSQQRGQRLRAHEEESKEALLAAAWEHWRDRLIANRLRPLEDEMLMRLKANLLVRAFGNWQRKTTILPALRFHNSQTKLKAWQVWRASMPRARQAHAARDFERRTTLKQTFSKWLQIYRSRIALKAVARARYLRLPEPPKPSFVKSLNDSMKPRSASTSSRPIASSSKQLLGVPKDRGLSRLLAPSTHRSIPPAPEAARPKSSQAVSSVDEKMNLWARLKSSTTEFPKRPSSVDP
ncbi:hypothetical protein SISSUDRAFT_1042035 [Sistotremastrum suecicum HHB10207 ss-3]|uniref:Sfi1 spindle body domain-containing protein n=1 Tax=Sistotremastrum suecicum HHB10207 ss-3 TaxID=1314776 RepID=A0A166GWQ3_9AGAM|nr:hypothetical protein SISSUDRAFT_1042035 [Sistotremastrum suecicum HHB10207 ss-3]